jgi:hypothetical protein
MFRYSGKVRRFVRRLQTGTVSRQIEKAGFSPPLLPKMCHFIQTCAALQHLTSSFGMGRSRMTYLLIGYILLSLLRGFQRRVLLAKLGSSRNTILCDRRELGSYETFLSRTLDSDERYVALSHGTVFLLSVAFDETLLQEACVVQMERYGCTDVHIVCNISQPCSQQASAFAIPRS